MNLFAVQAGIRLNQRHAGYFYAACCCGVVNWRLQYGCIKCGPYWTTDELALAASVS